MVITVKQLSDTAYKANDWQQHYGLEIDGKSVLHVSDGGEPEDNSLSRDLGFVYKIPALMKQAYEAGKNGEELVIKQVEVEDKEEMWI